MRQQPRRQTRPRRIAPVRQGLSWKYSALTFICGAIFVTGFFFAGKMHFSSMDYGLRNSRLRKQLDELEAEKRRLLLSREISLSPAELIRAARKAGVGSSSETVETAGMKTPTDTIRTKTSGPAIPVVQKTVISRPVIQTKAPILTKSGTIGKQAKPETKDRTKKLKS
jgi:hypothetical protein